MGSAARQVCASAGSEILRSSDGSDQILNILRKYFAPDAVDAIVQEVARPLELGGAGQTTFFRSSSTYFADKAVSKGKMGGRAPEALVSVF